MRPSVLFLLPYPLRLAPSQRFRIEAFFPILDANSIAYRVHCFFDEQAYSILYQEGGIFKKAWAVLRGFLQRLWVVLFVAHRYDFVVIHREAAPVGPPVFEWLLAKVFRKQVVYDFDDAIWIPAVSQNNGLAAHFKCYWKVSHICRWAHRVSVGNEYLARFAKQYNQAVHVIPTCVDTINRFNLIKDQASDRVVIGWTGSHSTLPYLDNLVPVLQQLEKQYDFDFLVICNQPPSFTLRNLRYLPWQEATEIEDLLRINIGVMPLVPDAWSEGKCGFKIIQYLALGIPAVASPVGVNCSIIKEPDYGSLCTTSKSWYAALSALLTSTALRTAQGRLGRNQMEAHYSIATHSYSFISLFMPEATTVVDHRGDTVYKSLP